MDIKKLLDYVRRINTCMTEEKMVKELVKSRYATRGLVIVAGNSKGR